MRKSSLRKTILSLALVLSASLCQADDTNKKHELLRVEVNAANPESVGRHFLYALGSGDRKAAESLMMQSKSFWASPDDQKFPYEEQYATALIQAANGELASKPLHGNGQSLLLGFDGIELALTKTESSRKWQVDTGRLFDTRSGMDHSFQVRRRAHPEKSVTVNSGIPPKSVRDIVVAKGQVENEEVKLYFEVKPDDR